MRIAVTGGLGRPGSCVMETLLPEHDAVAIDRIAGDGTFPAALADLSVAISARLPSISRRHPPPSSTGVNCCFTLAGATVS